MNHPCDKPASVCESSPNPLTGYSSADPDRLTFVGLAFGNEPPRLGRHFEDVPCFRIGDSNISQEQADFTAERAVAGCADPCSETFANSAQTAIGTCPDDNLFYFTVPADTFRASSQLLADRMAFTHAVKNLYRHKVCLSDFTGLACAGSAFAGEIVATGDFGPFSFSLVYGELPAGITMTEVISSSVVVSVGPNAVQFSGVATIPGLYTFIIECTDSAGSRTRKTYYFRVGGITDTVLPDAVVGSAYLIQVYAEGFTSVTWALVSGSLPAGLSLNADTGEISGTPTTAGVSGFRLSATGDGITCTKDYTITTMASEVDVCIEGIGSLLANVYAIDGYYSGLITNPNGPGADPEWDGTFPKSSDGVTLTFLGWASGEGGDFDMEGKTLCYVMIWFDGCTADVPQWRVTVGDYADIWEGTKAGGNTPEGEYTRIGGSSPTPAALTIAKIAGTTTPLLSDSSCSS